MTCDIYASCADMILISHTIAGLAGGLVIGFILGKKGVGEDDERGLPD